MAVARADFRFGFRFGGVSNREDSTRRRNIDTRLFEYENDDRWIQSCADEGREAGSPRVVQRNRLSSDTRGIEIGDLSGLAWGI